MSKFEVIRPEDADPIFDRIGKQWMLISASDGTTANTMTASWGGCGVLWNQPVAVCYLRPQRYTYTFCERSDTLSLAFLPEEYRKALVYCGSHSGRDVGDKFRAAGLTCTYTEDGIPYPAEAETVFLCRKLYADDLKEGCFTDASPLAEYPAKDFHRFYICKIEKVLRKV